MNKLKNNINIISSILLILTLSLSVLSGFVRFAISNKEIYTELLEKSNTYATIEEILSNKMNNILGSDIGENIKKSIITEEDIRREAELVLDIVISDIVSGQSVEPEIDTSIYKERIADALKSLTGLDVKLEKDNKCTSSSQVDDYCIIQVNAPVENSTAVIDNMIITNRVNENNNNDFAFFNMATRAELEAQGRAMLKEKGLTEEEARQKAAERGISEEDVWNYLEENGYLDEEENNTQIDNTYGEESTNEGQEKDLDNPKDEPISNSQINEDSSAGNDDVKVSKKNIQKIVSSVLMNNNKSFDEKMEEISEKLMDEAEKIINAEMEKLNFSKVIGSNKFKTSIKMTSFLYNNFYVFISFFIAMIILIIFNNKESFKKGFMIISKSISISGIIMSLFFGIIYIFKIYNYIDLGLNKEYFQPMFLETAGYFSKIFSIVSFIILLIGLVVNIFVIKRKVTRR